jgi:hypothetical protein
MKFVSWLKEMIRAPYEIRHTRQTINFYADALVLSRQRWDELRAKNEALLSRIAALEFAARAREHQEVIIMPVAEFHNLRVMTQARAETQQIESSISPYLNKLDIRN